MLPTLQVSLNFFYISPLYLFPNFSESLFTLFENIFFHHQKVMFTDLSSILIFLSQLFLFLLLYLFDSFKSGTLTSQALLFFLKVPLALWGLLCSWPGFGIRIRLASYNEFGSILLLQLFKMI